MEEDIKILQKADPAYQETLVCEVVLDPMEGEQTWPTDEEIKEAGKLLILYSWQRTSVFLLVYY